MEIEACCAFACPFWLVLTRELVEVVLPIVPEMSQLVSTKFIGSSLRGNVSFERDLWLKTSSPSFWFLPAIIILDVGISFGISWNISKWDFSNTALIRIWQSHLSLDTYPVQVQRRRWRQRAPTRSSGHGFFSILKIHWFPECRMMHGLAHKGFKG